MSGDVSKAKVTSEGLITLDYFGRSLLASRETGWFVDLLELKKKKEKMGFLSARSVKKRD